jgi:hypothetical protein
VRVIGVASRPRQVTQAKQPAGNAPLLVDAAHDGDRGLCQLLCLAQLALQSRDRGTHPQGVALIPPVASLLGDRQRLVGA